MSTTPFVINDTSNVVNLLARTIPDDQWVRELIQNGIDAGATHISIEPVFHDGRELIGVRDNGHGMTAKHLEDRMRSIADNSLAQNFGVGARIATLSFNPGGVYWASKTIKDREPHILMATMLGIQNQPGGGLTAPLKASWWSKPTLKMDGRQGTVVLLGGDGSGDTWANQQGRWAIATNINRRFWTYGRLNVEVRVENFNGKQARVPSLSEAVDGVDKETQGQLKMPDGTVINWWVLKEKAKRNSLNGNFKPQGVYVRDGHEIYLNGGASGNRMASFGIAGGVAGRVVIIIDPVAGSVHCNAQRTALLPANGGRFLPWVEWQDFFQHNFPKEIANLLPQGSQAAKQNLANALLDDNWRKLVKASPMLVERKGGAEVGTADDVEPTFVRKAANDPGDEVPTREGPRINRTRQGQRGSANKSATLKQRRALAASTGVVRGVVDPYARTLPQYQFVSEEDWEKDNSEVANYDYHFVESYQGGGSMLLVRQEGHAIVKSTHRWVKAYPKLSAGQVTGVVQEAYAVEQLARIVAFVSNHRPHWPSDTLVGPDLLVSPEVLTFASYGMLAVEAIIERELVKLESTRQAA